MARSCVGHRAGDQIHGRERRRDHEPVAHVRRRHLHPREGSERQPGEPSGPPTGPPVSRCGEEEDRRPCQGARERQRDRDRGRRHHHREHEAAHGRRRAPQVFLPEERVGPEPGEQRVQDDEDPQRRSRREASRRGPSGARRATRSGDQRRSDTRPSRTGSTEGSDRRRSSRPGTTIEAARRSGGRGAGW